MEVMIVVLLAAPLLGAAAYAHWRLPLHTAHRGRTWLLRAVLIGFGVIAGYTGVMLSVAAGEGYALRWAAFALGFGAAHLPAAVILMIKRRRGEYGHG